MNFIHGVEQIVWSIKLIYKYDLIIYCEIATFGYWLTCKLNGDNNNGSSTDYTNTGLFTLQANHSEYILYTIDLLSIACTNKSDVWANYYY